jgi:peptidoglycan/LPS O-acetylase OafA/YrhL
MQKIDELESLRGIAALFIAIYHIPHWGGAAFPEWARNGHMMVPFFFVLSGFVINANYAARIGSLKDLARFQFLRFGRLYPVHLLFLLIFIVIESSTRHLIGISATSTAQFDIYSAVAHHTLLIQAIGDTPFREVFNGPAWSISTEFYTYLVFGLIVLVLNRFKGVVFAGISVVSFILLITGKTMVSTMFVSCLAGFFLGCVVSLAVTKFTGRLPSYFPTTILIITFAFLVWNSNPRNYFCIYLLSAVLIFALTTSERGLCHRLLTVKPLMWLGMISYTVYMSHLAVEWFFFPRVHLVIKKLFRFFSFEQTSATFALEATIGGVTVVAAILFTSAFVYRFVEWPARRYSRHLALGEASNRRQGFA